jgi:hypothetical protein
MTDNNLESLSSLASSPPQSPAERGTISSTLPARSTLNVPQAQNSHPRSMSASDATSESTSITQVDTSIIKSKLKESELGMTVQNGLCPTSANFTPGTHPEFNRRLSEQWGGNDKYGASEMSLLARLSSTAQLKRTMANNPGAETNIFKHVGLNTASLPSYPGMEQTFTPEKTVAEIRTIESKPGWTKKSPKERLSIFPDCRFKNCEDMWAHQPTPSSKLEEILNWARIVENSMVSTDADNVLKQQEISNFWKVLREYNFDGVAEFRSLTSQVKHSLLYDQRYISDPLVRQLIEKISRLEQFENTRCAVMNIRLQERIRELWEQANHNKSRVVEMMQGERDDAFRQLNEGRMKTQSMAARIQGLIAENSALKEQLVTKEHALKQSQKESKKHRDSLKREIETLKAQVLSKSTEKLSAEVEEKIAKVSAVSDIIDTIRSSGPIFSPGQEPAVATAVLHSPDVQELPPQTTSMQESLDFANIEKDAATTALTTKAAEFLALQEASALATRKHNDVKEDFRQQIQSQNEKMDTLTLEIKQMKKIIEDVNLDCNRLRREKEVLENKLSSSAKERSGSENGVMRGRSKGKGKKGKIFRKDADFAVLAPESSSSGEDISAVQDASVQEEAIEASETESNGAKTGARITSFSMAALFLFILIPHVLVTVILPGGRNSTHTDFLIV